MNEPANQPNSMSMNNASEEATEAESIRKIKTGTSLLELLLLLVTAVGAYMAITSQLQAAKWRNKRAELEAISGVFSIDDATQYHVQLIPSDKPREYRWRVYAPELGNFSWKILNREQNGSRGKSFLGGSASAAEGLITVYFEVGHSFPVHVHVGERFQGNVSRAMSSLSSTAIKSMIEANDTSNWTIAGRDGIKKFGKQEMVWLIRIETDHDPITGKPRGLFAIGLGSQNAINEAQAEDENNGRPRQ
jgi:hypothetical protein